VGIGHAIFVVERIVDGIGLAYIAACEAKERFVFITIFSGSAVEDRPADRIRSAGIAALDLNVSTFLPLNRNRVCSKVSEVSNPKRIALKGRMIRSGLDGSMKPPGNKNCGLGKNRTRSS